MKYGNKKLVLLILVACTGTVLAILFIHNKYDVRVQTIQNAPEPNANLNQSTPPPNSKFIIPNSILLKVPFTPQAPTANWDKLHNESCEEASSIMVAQYFLDNKNKKLDPELVEGQITKLTEYQTARFGYHLDTTSEETAKMMHEVYGLQTSIIENFTKQGLKTSLAQGKLVIISFDGRLLGNPNYKQPGPPHHMLVIKGYTPENFITNDPGTKRGANYPYTFDALINAAGDWDHATEKVNLNKKIAIIVWK